ncbi:tRNA dihydrouridine(16) synthase DusC [Bacterioplanes sanyensis]|uniref:tRNA-dihydrouridine(16) synthase n=1 Tax=Bacterioplanes sanyensis TaxID=1249553 RepID=A0A222FL11_9GAMM|nr:tRNA-dihydrouridine synthase [Bacterioplanes sanyensis]ASP39449.1 tRNA dihydrouridine(16) synthase DusC [Bacterioplanes sanyensis]
MTFSGSLPFSQHTHAPYIALAPMEGLMDFNLRAILTAQGGIDHCVTEFIRITDQRLPERVFKRFCPELLTDGKTASGTPVHIQLLGSNPEMMAANAQKAAKLGAPAIDLNFGCPAKTVNKSQGGAVLLQWPDKLHAISKAVREAVPDHIPVSAKMRLGFTDKSLALENADALASAGIQWLTVHARTKTEGYKPPAHWQWIDRIRQQIAIPVLANGEVWNETDARDCLAHSGCDLLMIGRGLVAIPDLGRRIKHSWSSQQGPDPQFTPASWQQRLQLLPVLAAQLDHLADKALTDRLKQWLHYFSMQSDAIATVFTAVKRERQREAFFTALAGAIEAAEQQNQWQQYNYQHSGF